MIWSVILVTLVMYDEICFVTFKICFSGGPLVAINSKNNGCSFMDPRKVWHLISNFGQSVIIHLSFEWSLKIEYFRKKT